MLGPPGEPVRPASDEHGSGPASYVVEAWPATEEDWDAQADLLVWSVARRRISPAPVWKLLGLRAVSGAALTLAQGVDAAWLYPVGLVGVVIWAVRVRSYLGS
jgi:hypothetical protein